MRRLHPIVKYLLEQRYQQNILNEDEDSPVAKVASGSYAKLRKEFDAKVQKEAEANAKLSASITGKASKITKNDIDRAYLTVLDQDPQSVSLLTRNEYSNIAGDVTNPLILDRSSGRLEAQKAPGRGVQGYQSGWIARTATDLFGGKKDTKNDKLIAPAWEGIRQGEFLDNAGEYYEKHMDNPQNSKDDLLLTAGTGLAKSVGGSALRAMGLSKPSVLGVGRAATATALGGMEMLAYNRLMQGAENTIKGTEASPGAELFGNAAASATIPLAMAAPGLAIRGTKAAIPFVANQYAKAASSSPVRTAAIMATGLLDAPAASGMSSVEADMVARATRTTQVAPTYGTSMRSSAPNPAQSSAGSNVGGGKQVSTSVPVNSPKIVQNKVNLNQSSPNINLNTVIPSIPNQAPSQAPYQAPAQAPIQAPAQVPVQIPAQNPYQAPVQAPYQAPVVQKQTQTTGFGTTPPPPGGGGLLPPPGKVTLPSEPSRPVPPTLPGLPMGSNDNGGRGSYDDDEQKRMKGGDISAMLQNLYQTARTIRLR